MFVRKKVVLSVGGAFNPRISYGPLLNLKYFLTSVINKGGTTPVKLTQAQQDGTLEQSPGGYGGSGISNTTNPAANSPHGGGSHHQKDEEEADPAGDVARFVVETAKAGVIGAMETGLKIGDMAKQTADGLWDTARKTAQDVRDSVDDDEDHTRGSHGGELRRKGQSGYK